MKHLNQILFTTLILLSFYTSANAISFKIEFSEVHGLKNNDNMIHNKNIIGSVKKIVYSEDATFLVDVHLLDEFKHLATTATLFYVTKDPNSKKQKAIATTLHQKKGEPIKDGTVIKGTSKTYANLQRLSNKLYQNLQKISDSDAIKKLDKELHNLAEEMKQSEKAAREKIKEEVIPELKKNLEALKKKFQDSDKKNGKEIEALEQQVEELQKI